MIIKKLNSMFRKHSRWLFGIFAAIIIIAFMDFFTPGRGGCAFSGNPENQVVGTAFGKKVTYGDLIDLENDLRIFDALIGNASQRELRQLFYFYCIMKRAEQLGFTVSDTRIAELVRVMPQFNDGGKFSQDKYNEYLKDNHITSAALVASVRKALIVQQLPMSIISNVTVTDQEVENLYRSNFPRVAIRSFKVNAADFEKLVKVDQASLEKFMAANKAKYVVPGKLDLLAIELPAAAYMADAEKAVSDTAVADFIKKRGLDKVDSKVIRSMMVAQKANEFAAKKVNAFYRTVLSKLEEQQDSKLRKALFRDLAAAAKFTVIEAKDVLFSTEQIDNIVSADLVSELRSMPLNDTIIPLTRPRRSANGVALAYLVNRSNPRPMSFKEAEKQLTADFRKAQSLKLAAIKAKELWSAVMKNAPAKRSAAFGKLGKCETITFSMISAPANNPAHMAIVAAASPFLRTMKTGDISPVIECEDGSIIVEMVKRMPAVMSELDKNREKIKQEIMNNKAQQIQIEFITHLDRNCRYEVEDGKTEK